MSANVEQANSGMIECWTQIWYYAETSVCHNKILNGNLWQWVALKQMFLKFKDQKSSAANINHKSHVWPFFQLFRGNKSEHSDHFEKWVQSNLFLSG